MIDGDDFEGVGVEGLAQGFDGGQGRGAIGTGLGPPAVEGGFGFCCFLWRWVDPAVEF